MNDFPKTEIEAKVPFVVCRVPGGYVHVVDGEEKVLNLVTLREMTGHEEDILANDDMTITERMYSIIGSCITKLENDAGDQISDVKVLRGAPQKMLMADVLVLFYKVREVTVGDRFTQVIECPSCKVGSNSPRPYSWTHSFSLKDLSVTPTTGDRRAISREYRTKRGNVVTWELMTGSTDLAMQEEKKTKDRITAAMLMRVRTINGEVATKDRLKALPMLERHEIRQQFDQEGGLETDLDLTCPNCGNEFKCPVEINGKDFFYPSVTSKA